MQCVRRFYVRMQIGPATIEPMHPGVRNPFEHDPCFPLYRPDLERDECGVGFVADVRGRRTRELVERGLAALRRLTHRGAVAEAASVDGAGVLTQIPWTLIAGDLPRRLFDQAATRVLGMFFVPPGATAEVRRCVDAELRRAGFAAVHWRRVPVDPLVRRREDGRHIGLDAPDIQQAIAVAPSSVERLESKLHAVRLRLEQQTSTRGLAGFSVVSLSPTTVVYKGLLTPEELPRYYTDLRDPRFESALILFHQRFSTNSTVRWELAQPFRLLAHNGEINTIAGNRFWMRARHGDIVHPDAPGVPPVRDGGSDSQSLDDAVEVLREGGISLPRAFSRLIPPAWERDEDLPPDVAALYEYQSCFDEPWDGPAAIVFSDGGLVGALLDRNGLRPARFVRSAQGWLALGSEAGIFEFSDSEIEERGRLGPGQMVVVDLHRRSIHGTGDIRRKLARRRHYRRLVERAIVRLPERTLHPIAATARGGDPALRGLEPGRPAASDLQRLQKLFGCTNEEIEVILRVMAANGHEPVGSMGDDTPLAVLSPRARLLPDYFRQRFAQVTNPPMDPLRERSVMSLRTIVGPRGRYLGEHGVDGQLVALSSPVLTCDELATIVGLPRPRAATIPIVFSAGAGEAGLEQALTELVQIAADAVERGAGLIVLSDRAAAEGLAPIPPLLATSAVHHGLIARTLRMRASLIVETGEARDAHQVATLLAYGASAVCPYLGYATVETLASPASAGNGRQYRGALEEGLLKIFSKMGISTASGYCGAQLFDVVGLDEALVDRYFPGTRSPLGGLTLRDLARQVLERHAFAFTTDAPLLGYPGFHGYRRDGEYHANNPTLVRQFHRATSAGSAEAYEQFARMVNERPPTALRDLLEFTPVEPLPPDLVESRDDICTRFFTSAMSVGALSPEAHRTIAIAMNRLGGRSNSGEGGEEPERFQRPLDADPVSQQQRRSEGEWAGSATKQVASGRFGVTPGYLRSASELQIKIAQGSKPGEGGQLPASKVVEHIARLRYAQPGITLISPPVHHDIYSIEDLAQLIYDLRALHPAARINVKLVAQAGVGIVAAGVVKAGADAIQISGHDGGTGASPRGSIKHAGSPWELGLAEVQQVLTRQGLRDRVVLQADGGLKTGRDVAIAGALGADEFGFGTAAVVAIGCVMARQCHLNTCPIGIATQRPDLRARFAGTPEMLVTYFQLLADEVRRILAMLGLRRLDDLVGRADLLRPRADRTDRLTLAPLLVRAAGRSPRRAMESRPHMPAPDEIDPSRLANVSPERPLQITGSVANTDRAVGARVAGLVAGRFGDAGLPHRSVRLTLRGSAGQSFGAFCLPGMSLHLTGEANDYLGKSMHGGEIVVAGPSPRRGSDDVLVGNTALYGATGGRVFIGGRAGERFAVRNSGATAVVEGVGDHGCEYMTGGLVVVLGPVGRNFGAGMTGGAAFVHAGEGVTPRCNAEMVALADAGEDDRRLLVGLLADHARLTGSCRAADLLLRGAAALRDFQKVMPKQSRTHSAVEEVRQARVSGAAGRARASASFPARPVGPGWIADTPIPFRARAAGRPRARSTDRRHGLPVQLPGTE